MARTGTIIERPPTFLPLAAAIVLPVIALTALGLFLVKQDRRIIEHGAIERARSIAEDLAPRLWAELSRTNSAQIVMRIDSAAQLLQPSPWQIVPAPEPLQPETLTPSQAEAWQALQAASTQDDINLYERFLSLNPPTPFAAVTLYRLARAQMVSEPAAAMSSFRHLVALYPDAIGETGIPLKPLVQLQMLQIATDSPGLNELSNKLGGAAATLTSALCSNLVYSPTGLTGYILNHLSQLPMSDESKSIVEHWEGVWETDEVARRSHAHWRPFLLQHITNNADPRAFWIDAGRPGMFGDHWGREEDFHWLVLFSPKEAGEHEVICHSETNVAAQVRNLLGTSRHVPNYMGIEAKVGGERIRYNDEGIKVWHESIRMTRSGGQPQRDFTDRDSTEILASAQSSNAIVEMRVFLTSPTTLLKQSQARTFWMAGLVALSAAGAFVGLYAVRHAFERQVRLSTLKSNFVSSVSHELRAPTATILLLVENLDAGKVPEATDRQQYFQLILKECRRLTSLVESLLDFSRIEQGRREYQKEETDIRQLVRETVESTEIKASEQGVKMVIEGIAASEQPADESSLNADGRALQQALINLIDNALKHSPRHATVRVGMETDGMALQIWVEDGGPGIPASEHEKIFERFYRCGTELRRETPGVGIGLSIVKHVVESHGGRVIVRSAPGEGSRFTMEFPLSTGGEA